MNPPSPTPKGRLAVAAVALIAIAVTAGLLLSHDDPQRATGRTLQDCALMQPGIAAKACYSTAISRQITPASDPNDMLATLEATMLRLGSYPAAGCHVIMHTVGRRYAIAHKITLATLMRYLPRTNEAGCSAGFAHGVITAIAPEILQAGPNAARAVCDEARTRYLRYSCVHGLGHAYMRFYAEALAPSLKLCGALGVNAAPDCAQGVYHDYWLASTGQDQTRAPQGAPTTVPVLCESQPKVFVLPCWYRAFIETRPSGYQTKSAQDLRHICRQTTGLQRFGCITAAAVIGSPNPLAQLTVCRELATTDMLACIHGTKVQNVDAADLPDQLRVINRCSAFPTAVQTGCYEWLSKVLAVVTDGRFSQTGCPRVIRPRTCERGARSYNGPLITFS